MRNRCPPEVDITIVELDGETLAILALAPRGAALPPVAVTEIERGLLRAVARGLSNREIAEGRGRSIHTIAKQLAVLSRKFGVSSRVELAAAASAIDLGGDPRD